MAAYFYSFKIIAKIGHIKVLALGLLCNVIRFIYISFITWPWLILPFEFVQGIPIVKRNKNILRGLLVCLVSGPIVETAETVYDSTEVRAYAGN